MKITQSQLRQIIREEASRVLTEQSDPDMEYVYMDAPRLVGTWNPGNTEEKRFLPNAAGKDRQFKAGASIPNGTKKSKEAPAHSV
jgi:hypothetical protein